MGSTPQQMFNTIINSAGGKVKLEHLAKSVKNSSYDDFLEVLYAKLNEIMIKMENGRDKYFFHDEDAITGAIAARLDEAGYRATEQTKQNGSVDLTVILDSHKWIAEAKIAYSNSKILEGLIQLLTRYVTRTDESAGLLVYIKKRNSTSVVDSWESFLKGSKALNSYVAKKNTEVIDDLKSILKDVTVNRTDVYSFNSKHTLVSGLPISVQHFCADLYFNPADTSGNNGKKQREENAINNLANLYFAHLEAINDSPDSPFDSETCIPLLEQLFRELDPDDLESRD
ncbi:TPA: hypothetical protein ACPVXI_004214 [Vibrio parahaemolyticus]|uniref:hypothetical protein n=1 Tax=Vibrio hyugaensis TaxID=1534743 RepID=UPI0006939EB2|nr:hypothetical protein [Vibrio hyugaensis]HCE4765302.1 hypothetical protein [Vibrio parahaemolyticus]HCH3915075.1 hypothetical protein [Vibrio parahaemolyticus]